MESKLVSQYESLNKSLMKMKAEYKITPSKFLLKNIEYN
ncbi:hypothetical protein PMI10_00663 [Flavobacterium sp. CF136]|nr:hypothetical protein PMI10_00663 [Flavobacterium sp. CF136]